MADKRLTRPGHDKTRISYFANQTQHTPVGWCNNFKHKGKLSLRQMKNHKCLSKQCPFFKKNEEHTYWKERELIKRNKKKKQVSTYTKCARCSYMYHKESKPGQETYAGFMVKYCSYGDLGKVKNQYCSTKNPSNRCLHFKERGENSE